MGEGDADIQRDKILMGLLTAPHKPHKPKKPKKPERQAAQAPKDLDKLDNN